MQTDEAELFELVKHDNHDEGQCPVFGKFESGRAEFDEPKTLLKKEAPKILIEGRTLQQVELLEKLYASDANTKQSRLT